MNTKFIPWFGFKILQPSRKKKFFFTTPFSFSSEMTMDINNKIIFLNFVDWKNDKGNFKYLTDEKKKINSRVFAPLTNFSADMTNVTVSFNFEKFP